MRKVPSFKAPGHLEVEMPRATLTIQRDWGHPLMSWVLYRRLEGMEMMASCLRKTDLAEELFTLRKLINPDAEPLT